MHWTTGPGLDYWTGLLELKFKFFGFRGRFLSSHMSIGDFDDHENLNTHPYYHRKGTNFRSVKFSHFKGNGIMLIFAGAKRMPGFIA